MIRHLSMRASRPVMKGETSHFEGKTTRFPAHGVSALLFAMMSVVVLPAAAQRADDNAVTAASDAFGVTVGLQTIGLYGPTNVRGFNPAQAENLRIEGLYYDQQISYSNPFLFNRSDIRVGSAAQSYSFPSPTGIVDYKMRTPGDAALFSVVRSGGFAGCRTMRSTSTTCCSVRRSAACLLQFSLSRRRCARARAPATCASRG